MKKLEDLERICKETEQAVEYIEKKLLPYGKNSQIQEKLRKTLQNVNGLVRHNFSIAIALETLDILKVLQGNMQKYISQMTNSIYLVDTLKSGYDREQAEHKKLNLDEMSGKAIFTDSQRALSSIVTRHLSIGSTLTLAEPSNNLVDDPSTEHGGIILFEVLPSLRYVNFFKG